MRTLATTGLAMLALAASVPAASAADELIAPVGGPIDATGSHLAYSRPDGGGFRLVIDGRDAPVVARSEPFDVDLGTDARGRLVAVYTRSGSVRLFDVEAGRERAIPGARGSAPSVSRGRVVYATRSGRRDGLRLASLTGGRVERLPGPVTEGHRRLRVTETELAGGVLAFTAEAGGSPGRAQLWFARGAGRPQLLFSRVISSMQRTDLLNLAVSSRWVTAGLTHVGHGGYFSRAVRVSPGSGIQQEATLPDVPDGPRRFSERALQGIALGGGAAYSSACSQPPSVSDPGTPPECRLVRTTLQWRGLSG